MSSLFRNAHRSVWIALCVGIILGAVLSQWDWTSASLAQVTSTVRPDDPGAASSRRFNNVPPQNSVPPINNSVPPINKVQPNNNLSLNLPANLPPATAPLEIELTPEEQNSVRVYEVCNHSVVHIATEARIDSFLMVKTLKGSGSGSIIDNQGHILTNYHVIEGARQLTVSLHDGSSYPGAVVGYDTETDIAVVKIDAPTKVLEPLAWGHSTNLRVGQRIYAIGNPFGLERTMSTGIISSLNRQIPAGEHRTMRSLIQLDISLNQGNSGGPLINTRGELIGMNTAIMSTHGDSAGVGFAIAVATIRRIVPQLIRDGRVVRPTIGITRVYENDGGLLIVSVAPGGPAERAGLRGFTLKTKTLKQGPFRYEQAAVDPKTADMITAADGQPVRTADELLAIIESLQPGAVVNLTIVRDGRSQTVPVMLGSSDAVAER